MYGVQYEVPADEAMYRTVKGEIGDADAEGLVTQVVLKTDGGLLHIGIWKSKTDWERFRDGRVGPAVQKVLTAAGFQQLPPAPVEQELDVVDVLTTA